MNKSRTIATAAVLGVAFVSAVVAWQGKPLPEAPPPIPAEPAATPVVLVEAHPFELAVPAVHDWRAERPSYDRGVVLVLQTDPDLLVRRQTYEPVLYVGAETAQRVNDGWQSGNLVVVVPGEVDLSAAPIFFGEAALPEQVTADEAARQLAGAIEVGVQAVSVADAAARTRQTATFADFKELLVSASYLVEQYSAQEVDLVNGLRVPRVEFRDR